MMHGSDAFFAFLAVLVFGMAAIVLVPLFAGVASWMIGLFFEDTIRGVWRALGVNLDHFSMFQIGVALGFAGSFVKASLHTSKG